MKYLRHMFYRLVFVAFKKIACIKPLYKVVGCLQSTRAKRGICLLNSKRISVLTHTLTANSFPQYND